MLLGQKRIGGRRARLRYGDPAQPEVVATRDLHVELAHRVTTRDEPLSVGVARDLPVAGSRRSPSPCTDPSRYRCPPGRCRRSSYLPPGSSWSSARRCWWWSRASVVLVVASVVGGAALDHLRHAAARWPPHRPVLAGRAGRGARGRGVRSGLRARAAGRDGGGDDRHEEQGDARQHPAGPPSWRATPWEHGCWPSGVARRRVSLCFSPSAMTLSSVGYSYLSASMGLSPAARRAG